MATSVLLHPLAQAALDDLQARLETEEGRDASDRKIVSALVYGATPAQTAGMLIAFTRAARLAEQKAKATAAAAESDEPGNAA